MAGSRQQGSKQQRRVRRAKDKDGILNLLRDQGPFKDYRDVLVFAAALGWKHGRRVPFDSTSEAIRWDTAANRFGTEELVLMLAAASSDDREILANSRFEDRVLVFEEYANGGLEIVESALKRAPRPPSDVLVETLQEALLEVAGGSPDPLNIAAAIADSALLRSASGEAGVDDSDGQAVGTPDRDTTDPDGLETKSGG